MLLPEGQVKNSLQSGRLISFLMAISTRWLVSSGPDLNMKLYQWPHFGIL